MSRLAIPEGYEETSTQLFLPFLQQRPDQVNDREYYGIVMLFLKAIITLESYHQFWKREADFEPFDSILMILIQRSFEQARFNQEQLEQIVSWVTDQRFIMMLALLSQWSSSETGRMQLNRLVHQQYDKDTDQQDLVDNSHIPPLLTLLQKRLIAHFLENVSSSGDVVGLLIGKHNTYHQDSAIRFFNLLCLNDTKLPALFEYLAENRHLSILDVTQDYFASIGLCDETTLIKDAHKCMSQFIIEELSNPRRRAVTFIISAYEQEESIDHLLWGTPFLGIRDLIPENDPVQIQAFLKEVLTTLYMIVMPHELPTAVMNELQVTFSGAPNDDFMTRVVEFRQDPYFKTLLRHLLSLAPADSLNDFNALINQLAGKLPAYQSSSEIPQSIEEPDDRMLEAIKVWNITPESHEVLTVVAHQCMDLQNLRYCETKQAEQQSIWETEAKEKIRLALDTKKSSGESLTAEEEASLRDGVSLTATVKFDFAQQAWADSRQAHCLRKKTELYEIGSQSAASQDNRMSQALSPVRELYDQEYRVRRSTLAEERQKQESLRSEKTRERENSFRKAGMDEGMRAGIQAGIEAHKRIVKSRLTKIAFGLLAAVGVGLLIYLTVQTCGAMAAAIAIGIALKPLWIAGGVTAGIGSFGWIGKYAKDRGWFANKAPKPPRSVQQSGVTQAVTAGRLDLSIQSALSSKKTDSLKSNQSNDSAVVSDTAATPFLKSQPSSEGGLLASVGTFKPKRLAFEGDITADADDSDEAAPVYG